MKKIYPWISVRARKVRAPSRCDNGSKKLQGIKHQSTCLFLWMSMRKACVKRSQVKVVLLLLVQTEMTFVRFVKMSQTNYIIIYIIILLVIIIIILSLWRIKKVRCLAAMRMSRFWATGALLGGCGGPTPWHTAKTPPSSSYQAFLSQNAAKTKTKTKTKTNQKTNKEQDRQRHGSPSS